MPKQCPFCGSLDLKEDEDRSKPPISFVPRPIYLKKYTCKKCRKSFSKEQMENPASVSKPHEQEEAPAEPVEAKSKGMEATTPPARKKGMAARLFEAEESTAEPEPSPEPAAEAPGPRALPSRAVKGFATLESSSEQQQPAEKKSYMQIMKEKSLYQAQQFESTMEVEAEETKPAPKPAPKPAVKPAAKPAAAKPAASVKPVKPAGAAPPVPKPGAKPIQAQKPSVPEPEGEDEFTSPPPELPKELPELPDLPSLEEASNEAALITSPVEAIEEPDTVVELPVQKPARMKPPVQKPAGMKPPVGPPVQKRAGMKPPVGPPVQKPAGMKPPIQKPAGMKPPVQKPAGMKPPVQKPAGMKPPIKPPGQFQSFESPKRAAPIPPVPTAAPQISRLDQLKEALNIVLNQLAWPQEKKDALMQELVSLPEDQQTDFLEQLGVEVPAEAPVSQPAPFVPEMPESYEAPPTEVAVPVPPMRMPAKPPAKPAGMKPMKPSIAPPVAPPGVIPAPPVMKPMKPAKGARPAAVPPVLPPEKLAAPPVMKPAKPAKGAKPAAVPPVLPPEGLFVHPVAKSASSNESLFFKDIDKEIEQTVGSEFDLGKLLEADLSKTVETEAPAVTKRGKGKAPKKKGKAEAIPVAIPEEEVPVAPAVPEAAPPGAPKGPIKLSQISTRVEKKSAAELKKEEDKLKEAASSESSLVYMRLLGFEKLASVGKTYKLGEFCKTLKDIEPQVVIDFVKSVDNDILIAYDENKGQVVVSDLSGPELEIMSRQFEKWLRFGRL